MSYYLIGIGGTGARCLESFIHLIGAGLLKDTQPVKMIFVDADVSCGNLVRTQKAADLYIEARKLGFGTTGLMKNKLETMDVWTPVPENCSDLNDVFQSKVLSNMNQYQPLNMLYNALFTEQERTTPLDKGFRGHPAIGAAVMNSSVSGDTDTMWQEVFQQINTDKDARIFLFASVFGGTGAAGFPTIARIIKRSLKKDQEGNTIAKIGGVLVLPYFQFPPASFAEEEEMQAKVDEFILNTKSALDYYNKSELLKEVFQRIYLIGDSDLADVKTFSLGSNTQENDANVVELYAALAAFDFFNKNEFGEKSGTPMIARGDDTKDTIDKIQWEDLPNPCIDGHLKDKLYAYIKFLYTYRHCVLVNLEKCAAEESYKRQVAWYKDLVQKAGKIDVYHDRQIMTEFKALGDYAEAFFRWIKDISDHPKRKIELVNKQVSTKPEALQFSLDVYQVVLPIVERKDKLTHKEFWNQLCSYTKKLKKTTNSGAEILMQAIYDICSK